MDPTQRKPRPNPSASKRHHIRHHPPFLIHPLPDPGVTPPSTIQNISHRFSKLYVNHKKLVSRSSKTGPHPQPDPHFQTNKDISFFPPVSDISCTALTKSTTQRERISSSFDSAVAKIMEDNQKLDPKKSYLEASELILKCLGNEETKGLEAGGLMLSEGKRRSSLSCIPPPVVNNGGTRRSFCNSQVELAGFLACSGVKVVAVDMPPFMQVHAVDCARKAHDSLEKFTSKTLAYTLKKEFDGVYGPAWHCIVGTSFGSFVTHSVGGFMYFSMDHKLYILLFKTTVQRAE